MNVIEKLEPWKAATLSITRHDDEGSGVRKGLIQDMVEFLEKESAEIDERDEARIADMRKAAAEVTSEKPKKTGKAAKLDDSFSIDDIGNG